MKKNGFAMVEVVVASVIFLIIFGASLSFYIDNTKVLKLEKQKANIDSDVKSLMDYINQSLKTAWQNTIEINKDENEIKMVVPVDNSIPVPTDLQLSRGINLTFKKDGYSIKIIKEKSEEPMYTEVSYLTGYVKSFNVKNEPNGSNLVVITLTIDYKISGMENKTYYIYYNLRKD